MRYLPLEVQDRIEQVILDSNMNCTEIAKRLNVDRKTIYHIKNGGTFNVLLLLKLCKLLHVSADYLLGINER